MSQTGLTFTEKTHQYTENGAGIPSVSRVLELTGISDVSGIPIANLQRAADRGTAVHLACRYLDEDDLVLDSLDPKILGYVVAYQKFREEYEFVPEIIEKAMVGECAGMRFGMTLDRVGRLTTPEGEFRVLLDLKTASKPSTAWAIQTAAYTVGFSSQDKGLRPMRAVVHLAKDATYKVLVHGEDSDFDVWEAALTLAWWKIRKGTKL